MLPGQVKPLIIPCDWQAWRLPTVRQAQIRHSSVFNEFKKKVQEELDRYVHSCCHAYHALPGGKVLLGCETRACCCSNPALKQSVEELKQKTGSLMERYACEQQWQYSVKCLIAVPSGGALCCSCRTKTASEELQKAATASAEATRAATQQVDVCSACLEHCAACLWAQCR